MCSAVSTLESFLCIFGTYTNFLKTQEIQEIATYVSNSLEIFFFFCNSNIYLCFKMGRKQKRTNETDASLTTFCFIAQ